MAKPKQAFVVEKTALPACGGCSQCGDLDDRHLYILGHDKKYYCKVCFFKIATQWPKAAGGAKAREVVRIDLTNDQIRRGKGIGQRRHANKEAKGVKDHRSSSRLTSEQAHIIGAVFEVAVADKYGLDMDESITDGPDRFDFELPCGCILSARARDAQARLDRVIVSDSKDPLRKPKADFFIWGLKRERGFDVLGASDVRDWPRFQREKVSLHDFGRGVRQTVVLANLDPVEILFQHNHDGVACGQGRVQEVQGDNHVRDGND